MKWQVVFARLAIWRARTPVASTSSIGWCTRSSRRRRRFACCECGLTMSDTRDNRWVDATLTGGAHRLSARPWPLETTAPAETPLPGTRPPPAPAGPARRCPRASHARPCRRAWRGRRPAAPLSPRQRRAGVHRPLLDGRAAHAAVVEGRLLPLRRLRKIPAGRPVSANVCRSASRYALPVCDPPRTVTDVDASRRAGVYIRQYIH